MVAKYLFSGGVQFFYRLTVCNLSGNFITDISPLLSCPHLAKVDLSSNQITNFPHLGSYLLYLMPNPQLPPSPLQKNPLATPPFFQFIDLVKNFKHINKNCKYGINIGMKNNLNNLLILNIPTFSLKTTRKTQYKLCSGKSEKRTPSFLDFWASFSRLRMLLLHDNGIGRLSCVQALSFAPSIEFLTLFDTPLSIRPSYRHHVVNSITTLKGHKSIKLAGFYLVRGE